jgi:hypothetical protein
MKLIALLAVALLALAPPAAAKGPTSLEVCGATTCRTFSDRTHNALVYGVVNAEQDFEFTSSPPLGSYYELRLQADWLEEGALVPGQYFFVPAGAALLVGTNWVRPSPALAHSLRAAVRGLEPFPEPGLTRVLVGGRVAADPAPYAALFADLPPGRAPRHSCKCFEVKIFVEADRPNPWTEPNRPLQFYAGAGVLHRRVEWVKLPPRLSRLIEGDARFDEGLNEPKASDLGAAGYLGGAAAALGLTGLLAVSLRARRRRRGREA